MELSNTTLGKKGISRWVWIGCVLLVIAAGLHSADKIVGGGDTWVAMECGRFTVGPWAMNHPGRTWQMRLLDKFGIHITNKDPYSAASRSYIPSDHENFGWVNQNWLTHVMFYKMKTALGGDWREPQKGELLIVIYKFLQAVLTALFAYWAARVLGAHFLLAGAAAAFGILISRSFVDLRANVSTIFFASVMIFLLALWRERRYRLLLWMIPVMIIGSNVHGGFIYPIIIFWIALGGYLMMKLLHSSLPGRFVQVSSRGIRWLAIMAVVVTLIPGIFSPFGWENLIHPFLVATGSEGVVWRDVIEWKPIWDNSGFGNERPYIYFLTILGIVFVVWWVLYFLKPVQPQPRRRQRQIPAVDNWPRIDLAHLGIMGITVYMSIMSRRFIFLGGVVLAPFLAIMTQEIINMVRLRRRHAHQEALELAPIGWKAALWLASMSMIAAILTGLVFIWAMWDMYFRPPADGEVKTVFRKMVGINDQPVRGIKFFDANRIKGKVFNEWTNGGFIAFNQTPNAETGEPACKVFMDGRSQAAYKVRHFAYWRSLRSVPKKPDDKYYAEVKRLAAKMGLSPTDPEFFDGLIDKLLKIKLKKEQFRSAKEALRAEQYYQTMIHFAVGELELYENILERDGLNVALLTLRRSKDLFRVFGRSMKWSLLYIDNRHAMFFRVDAPENRELLRKKPSRLKYPDEYSRNFSIGYINCHNSNPRVAAQGAKMLMKVKRYVPMIYDMIYNVGIKLGMQGELQKYFSQKHDLYLDKVEKKEELGRLNNMVALAHSSQLLEQLSKKAGKPDDAQRYHNEAKHYNTMISSRQEKEKWKQWLW